MANNVDWQKIRARAFIEAETPVGWPQGVRPISLDGVTLFGIDLRGRLYWDGEPIEVRKLLSLTCWQRIGAVIITLSTFAGAIVQVWRFVLDYWR